MVFVGMTIAAVRESSRALNRQATELNSIRATIDRLVTEASREWDGADIRSFRSQWYSRDRARMQRAYARLSAMAGELTRQANEQERTSRDGVSIGKINIGPVNGFPSLPPISSDKQKVLEGYFGPLGKWIERILQWLQGDEGARGTITDYFGDLPEHLRETGEQIAAWFQDLWKRGETGQLQADIETEIFDVLFPGHGSDVLAEIDKMRRFMNLENLFVSLGFPQWAAGLAAEFIPQSSVEGFVNGMDGSISGLHQLVFGKGNYGVGAVLDRSIGLWTHVAGNGSTASAFLGEKTVGGCFVGLISSACSMNVAGLEFVRSCMDGGMQEFGDEMMASAEGISNSAVSVEWNGITMDFSEAFDTAGDMAFGIGQGLSSFGGWLKSIY